MSRCLSHSPPFNISYLPPSVFFSVNHVNRAGLHFRLMTSTFDHFVSVFYASSIGLCCSPIFTQDFVWMSSTSLFTLCCSRWELLVWLVLRVIVIIIMSFIVIYSFHFLLNLNSCNCCCLIVRLLHPAMVRLSARFYLYRIVFRLHSLFLNYRLLFR